MPAVLAAQVTNREGAHITIYEGYTTESLNAGYSILWLFVGGASVAALFLIVKLFSIAWDRYIYGRFFAKAAQPEAQALIPKDEKEDC